MNSDETDATWIALSAAVRNVVALLTVRNEKVTAGMEGESTAPAVTVSAAGVPTELETARVDFRETARRPRNGAIETPATLGKL